jgi:hypothetical protein
MMPRVKPEGMLFGKPLGVGLRLMRATPVDAAGHSTKAAYARAAWIY